MGQVGGGATAPPSAPVPLSPAHDLSGFDCGKAPLNDWLRSKALKADGRSARTFVICEGIGVIGYYCLAAGGIHHDAAPSALKRNMPNPVPVMVLGRLAIDRTRHGTGLGSALFRDALLRVAGIQKQTGVAALLVHALDDEAKAFYLRYGMQEFPPGSRTLFLAVKTILSTL